MTDKRDAARGVCISNKRGRRITYEYGTSLSKKTKRENETVDVVVLM
jgi:hypothetical protein